MQARRESSDGKEPLAWNDRRETTRATPDLRAEDRIETRNGFDVFRLVAARTVPAADSRAADSPLRPAALVPERGARTMRNVAPRVPRTAQAVGPRGNRVRAVSRRPPPCRGTTRGGSVYASP